MKSFLLFCIIASVYAVPVWQPPANDTNATLEGAPPCCQGTCTKPGEEKYWSLAKVCIFVNSEYYGEIWSLHSEIVIDGFAGHPRYETLRRMLHEPQGVQALSFL